MAGYLTARQAAEELGISLPTLYAYVSRSLIRSEAAGGSRRNRRYRAEDVRRLKERKERRRDPARVVEEALHWGAPVLESGITLISDGRIYYRGRDALVLAGSRSVEQVAALIWMGDLPSEVPEIFGPDSSTHAYHPIAARQNVAHLGPLESFQALLPLAAVEDLAAYDLRPLSVAKTGARILRLMAAIAAGTPAGPDGIAGTLRRGWAPRGQGAENLFNAALILCADHELPVSTFAARCVASSGATPYAVVMAGLSAVQGVRHGGQIERVEALLREVEASDGARRVVAERLRRGERVPGFGHSLYPEGDPRGAELLRLVAAAYPQAPAVELSAAVVEEALELLGERPTVDFGLVIVARALDLPPGAAVALFALGRTVGWIGHAIEQYGSEELIRPRARYVGELPAERTG